MPSYEEFMKTYEVDEKVIDSYRDEIEYVNVWAPKGSGPCKNSLCGCSCHSYNCKCEGSSVRVSGTGTNFSLHSRKKEIGYPKSVDELILKEMGSKHSEVSGQASGSIFGYKDSGGEVRFLGGSVGSEVTATSIKGKLSADVYNFKSDGVQARIGASLDSGISFGNGEAEVKLAGFGLNLSDEQVGISTPIGEIKVDTDKCVIQ